LFYSCDAVELQEWRHYYHEEPFGDRMLMRQIAITAQAVANFSGRVKRPMRYDNFLIESPSEFTLRQRRQAKLDAQEQKAQRTAAIIRRIFKGQYSEPEEDETELSEEELLNGTEY